MKIKKILGTLVFLLSINLGAQAAINVIDGTYHVNSYYGGGGDNIVSYDWGSSGELYYMTATSAFGFGGLYQAGVTDPLVNGNGSLYPGSSVVAIGDHIYYSYSDFNGEFISKYGPLPGTSSAIQVSTTANSSLHVHNGKMFIAGAYNFGTNHIYYSEIEPNGDLTSGNSAIDLGETSGSSGPLAFDAIGNLYYAPGYGDLSIYKWSASEVAAAMADPILNPLTATGNLWMNYGGDYGFVGGGTSMLIDGEGDLLLSLTSFSDPSILAKFEVGLDGGYNGSTNIILEDTDRLGDLRMYNGEVYLSSGNTIYTVLPEPSTGLLLVLGGLILFFGAGRKRTCRAE